MIGRNFIVKIAKIFLKHNAKKIPYHYREIVKKTKNFT